jgi:hypothetical protein
MDKEDGKTQKKHKSVDQFKLDLHCCQTSSQSYTIIWHLLFVICYFCLFFSYPYIYEPCLHHVEGTSRPICSGLSLGGLSFTPSCAATCTATSGLSFDSDRNFGDAVYRVPKNAEQIKAEIYRHGPVEAAFAVYADFPSYKVKK